MDNHRHDDRGGAGHHHHGCDERHPGHDQGGGPEGGSRGERHDDRGGDRPDTRFLQLEMSQVLYGEAEAITKQAFRELLVEAAKDRWRERFGDTIGELARLAVDELMKDVQSSLDIESRIRERNQDRGSTRDRLQAIFTAGEAQPKGRAPSGGGTAPRRGKR